MGQHDTVNAILPHIAAMTEFDEPVCRAALERLVASTQLSLEEIANGVLLGLQGVPGQHILVSQFKTAARKYQRKHPRLNEERQRFVREAQEVKATFTDVKQVYVYGASRTLEQNWARLSVSPSVFLALNGEHPGYESYCVVHRPLTQDDRDRLGLILLHCPLSPKEEQSHA